MSVKLQCVLVLALGAAGCGSSSSGGGGGGSGGSIADAGPGGNGGGGDTGGATGGTTGGATGGATGGTTGGSGGQGTGGTPVGGSVGGGGGGGTAGGAGGEPVGGTVGGAGGTGGQGGQATGGVGGEPVGGAGGAGGSGMGGAGGSGGSVVPATLDCDEFCLMYHAECAGYFALRSTCDILCPAIAEGMALGLHVETFDRADENCREGQAAQACGQMYACMNDDDGLNAIGDGATIRYEGILNGVPVDLGAPDAWLMVGTKADGMPGDLEAIFEAEGVVYSIEMNDFLADWDPVAMDEAILENNKVDRTTEVERIRLRVQSIDINSLTMDGPVDFSAVLTDPDQPPGTSEINLTVTGSLHR